MLRAGLVVVRQYGYLRPVQPPGILLKPLLRPAGIAGRAQAKGVEPVCVLFALHNPYRFVSGYGSQYFGEPVQLPLQSLYAPRPPACAVGTALSEVLGLKTHHLVDQVAAFIEVVVLGDDLRGHFVVLGEHPCDHCRHDRSLRLSPRHPPHPFGKVAQRVRKALVVVLLDKGKDISSILALGVALPVPRARVDLEVGILAVMDRAVSAQSVAVGLEIYDLPVEGFPPAVHGVQEFLLVAGIGKRRQESSPYSEWVSFK